MQYQSFLIKYAEIGTKGKNRYLFEDALIKQIRYSLRNVEGSFNVTKESGRIYVMAEGEYDYDDTIEALKRVFGIAGICPMVQIEDKDYENLKRSVVEYMDQGYGRGYFGGISGDEGGCPSSPGAFESGGASEDQPVFPDHPWTGRNAGRDQREGHAPAFRRH